MAFKHSKDFTVTSSFFNEIHGNATTHHHYTDKRVTIVNSGGSSTSGLQNLQSYVATGAMHNSRERRDAPKCHKDTRKAVIKDITTWVSDDSKDTMILWLSAPAGSGKSAILQTIAERFHTSKQLAASFFFSRTAPQRHTETYLVATIAAQLANSIPSTRPFIEQVVLDDLSIFDKALIDQMELLVIQPLIQASLQVQWSDPWPSLLIIDSLDECDDGKVQADILHMLNHTLLRIKCSLPRLRLLISSRPEPAICDVFEDTLSAITHHLVLDNSYHPYRDIATFLRSSFLDIYHRRRIRFPSMASLSLPWPSEDVISFLVKKSSGQFIFAATVIRFVDEDRKLPTAQLKLILDVCRSPDTSERKTNPFALLDQLYAHVLRSSEDLENVLSLLGAIFYLEGNQKLSPAFLECLLDVNLEDVVLLFWDFHSIIHFPASRTDPIRFYHASFRDYLLDHHRSGDFCIEEHAAHSRLLKACMLQLSKDPSLWPVSDPQAVLAYSRKSWSHHYSCGNSINAGSLDHVLESFKPLHSFSLPHSSAVEGLAYWWKIYAGALKLWHSECNSEFCTPLCCRFTSILDRHLLSWLEDFPRTKSGIPLMWFTPSFRDCTVKLISWERIALSGFLKSDIPDIDWLFDLHYKFGDLVIEEEFLQFLRSFLQDSKRCHHLSIGKALSAGHFTHLCSQLILDNFLGSPNNLDNQRLITYLHKMLSLILKMPYICEYEHFSAIEKCIESQLGSPEVFVNEANSKLLEWYARGQDTRDSLQNVEPLQSIESGETRQSVDSRESRESIESGEPRQSIESSKSRRNVESSEPRQNLLESGHSRQAVNRGERQSIDSQPSLQNVENGQSHLQNVESGEPRHNIKSSKLFQNLDSSQPLQIIQSEEPRQNVDIKESSQDVPVDSRVSIQNVESKESRQGINSQESQRNVESLGEPPKNVKNEDSLQNVPQQNIRSRNSLHQNVEREKPDEKVDAGVKKFWHRFSEFWIGICCTWCKKEKE